MSRPWPDYGAPGNPNSDPYYISPEREREMEEDRIGNIEGTIDAYGDDLTGVLRDLATSLAKYNATITAVTIDAATLDVKIEVKS